MFRKDPYGGLRGSEPTSGGGAPRAGGAAGIANRIVPQQDDIRDDGWSWPPYAPLQAPGTPAFDIEEWAPPSVVWHPAVRLGRWTVVYRRSA